MQQYTIAILALNVRVTAEKTSKNNGKNPPKKKKYVQKFLTSWLSDIQLKGLA